MVILNFTLSEEGVAVLHDALACMFKFSDDVCLEAKKDKVKNPQGFRFFTLMPLCQCIELIVFSPVDPNHAQHLQVSICLFLLCRQQVLLTIQF